MTLTFKIASEEESFPISDSILCEIIAKETCNDNAKYGLFWGFAGLCVPLVCFQFALVVENDFLGVILNIQFNVQQSFFFLFFSIPFGKRNDWTCGIFGLFLSCCMCSIWLWSNGLWLLFCHMFCCLFFNFGSFIFMPYFSFENEIQLTHKVRPLLKLLIDCFSFFNHLPTICLPLHPTSFLIACTQLTHVFLMCWYLLSKH